RALTDAQERLAVARDFMTQLARLHAIDPAQTPVEGLGPLTGVEQEVDRRPAALRARNSGPAWDPLVHLSLNWLEANRPDASIRPVIVHGDAGPGNFLFDQGRVTILLDWELVHYGDPMADLAML